MDDKAFRVAGRRIVDYQRFVVIRLGAKTGYISSEADRPSQCVHTSVYVIPPRRKRRDFVSAWHARLRNPPLQLTDGLARSKSKAGM